MWYPMRIILDIGPTDKLNDLNYSTSGGRRELWGVAWWTVMVDEGAQRRDDETQAGTPFFERTAYAWSPLLPNEI